MMQKYLIFLLNLLLVLISCETDYEISQNQNKLINIDWYSYNVLNSDLPDNFIVSVLFDNNNNLWVGTFAKGIAKYNGTTWQIFNTQNSGLSNDSILDIACDKQNRIWIGTINGLSVFDGANWIAYTTLNSPLPIRMVSAIAVSRTNSIWLGCGNATRGGLIKLEGGEWELFTPENSALPCRIINKIFIDKFENIWLATGLYQGNGGVVKITNDIWRVFNKQNSALEYNYATDITQDYYGNIWIAVSATYHNDPLIYDGGIYKFNGLFWETIKPHDQIPALSNRVNTIRIDKYNNIWITTLIEGILNYQMAMFNEKNWNLISAVDPAFPHDFIMDLEFNNQNVFWIGLTGYGITKLIPVYE